MIATRNDCGLRVRTQACIATTCPARFSNHCARSGRGYPGSNRSACRRYFTGMIIGYPFGVTTVINHLCMLVLLVLVAQCTYAGLSAGEYALTVTPGFMGIDGLPNSRIPPVRSSTYASSCSGW